MVDYSMAWLVAGGAGLLALLFWCFVTRGIANWFWRTLLRGLAAVWMLLPAPVPGYDGQYAPAYVVALFEAAFQQEGEPTLALIILVAGALGVLLVLALWALLRRLIFGPAAAPPTDDSAVTPSAG